MKKIYQKPEIQVVKLQIEQSIISMSTPGIGDGSGNNTLDPENGEFD